MCKGFFSWTELAFGMCAFPIAQTYNNLLTSYPEKRYTHNTWQGSPNLKSSGADEVNLGGMAANHCHSCEGDGMIVLWVQYTHDLLNIWKQNPLHPTYV